ncbi:MAG: hypothetical protein IMY72_00600 [Bacteroidetes bacterium]|nr:hypothetical protein [Bacteroidota bacterium]
MDLFDSEKKGKTILDLFTYDLTTFFYGEYEEVDSEETEETFMIVYEKKLPWTELNAFDTLQFRVFFDKHNITGSNPINVKLLAKDTIIDIDNVKSVVENVFDVYGKDDDERAEWTNQDKIDFFSKKLKRIWTIEKGVSFVTVYYNEDEKLVLNILFLNNLIKHTGKYLDLK